MRAVLISGQVVEMYRTKARHSLHVFVVIPVLVNGDHNFDRGFFLCNSEHHVKAYIFEILESETGKRLRRW